MTAINHGTLREMMWTLPSPEMADPLKFSRTFRSHRIPQKFSTYVFHRARSQGWRAKPQQALFHIFLFLTLSDDFRVPRRMRNRGNLSRFLFRSIAEDCLSVSLCLCLSRVGGRRDDGRRCTRPRHQQRGYRVLAPP